MKFQHKYRIESARLHGYDYGSNGAYYLTICTKWRAHYFGEIVCNNGVSTMVLNDVGKTAELFLRSISDHFPFAMVDEYVVMPDHLHMIIFINKPDNAGCVDDAVGVSVVDDAVGVSVETLQCNVSTGITGTSDTSDGHSKNIAMSRISPKPGTISTIIRSYKSAVSKHVRQSNASFEWQSRFYDRIIRDYEALNEIRGYIRENVCNWKL